ncbi:hypothetical protein CVT26_008592 [Gymnopilus dilepis]|uniref:Laccase n=1 Tax=Gymnopilus dilepis TaxID=231916 RepID=A0A409XXS0_9AGAR|nr:hypothetical protein CVT26_008592 [Gymnopilus dilepis]
MSAFAATFDAFMVMKSSTRIIGSLLMTAATATAAIGPSANLVIANKAISPDGFSRSAVLAGASSNSLQFPGPLITGKKGDTFQLNVIDHLTDKTMLTSTSIHWHGLFQEKSSWADGPVGVTQCPIAPGHSFLYKFSVPDQAGTYWYHSHYSTQYCDGLRGALVVYDPADPHRSLYEVDNESTVITLSDWYHFPAPAATGVPMPNSTLINGLGRAPNGTSALTVINVKPNTRYRFRLVSLSCDPNFVFSIDGHNMTIIEVDGQSTKPLTVDSIQIYAGQRYSFVLNTFKADQSLGNYWIRALPNLGATSKGFDGGVNSAILRYVGAKAVDPTTTSVLKNPLLETNLHPLTNPQAPGHNKPADKKLNLDITFSNGTFKVNNATFSPPKVPVLLQILSHKYTPQQLLPKGSVYPLEPNQVVEITLPGGSTGSPHPIHLHGHAFSVIRSANSTVYNYDNPVRRDVVNIGTDINDRVTIRFKTDNAGPWILHCHIDWHLEAGMGCTLPNLRRIAASNLLIALKILWFQMKTFLGSVLLSASIAAAAIGPSANIFVANKFITPDGFNRSAVLAGASEDSIQFPGPLITGNKGDTFQLNVIDNLTNTSMLTSTSIHWHGLFQNKSSWADGPVGVTQCPITPGNSFLYEFDVPNQAGTFWYHSHYQTQYCDGLRGAFVVYDPSDPHKALYDVDDESTVITLADWYHTPAPSAGSVPKSSATLINGLGRTAGGTSELAVINVKPDTRYRFRLVSISCDPNFNFTIDGHNMTIIEVDGQNTEPLVVDFIQIFAGQRYSFILQTFKAADSLGNYWIRSLANIGPQGFNGGVNSAILRYVGADEVDPTTTASPSVIPLVETNLHPLENPQAPGYNRTADIQLSLPVSFSNGSFKVNGTSFMPPKVPVLLQILSHQYTPQELMPEGSVYLLEPNKVVEITMPGASTSAGNPHPIHLHGHSFSVVRSAGNSSYNYDNPVRRDVVSMGSSASDLVTIRFETDNSGPWIMHCHIDWHLEAGLAVVMAENFDGIQSNPSPPPAWDQLCPTFDALPPQTF